MKEQIKKALGKTRKAITGVAKHDSAKNTIDWSRKVGSGLKDQTIDLGKEVIGSDLGKAAAKGAAMGAIAALPIPLVGPEVGAVVGAGIGIYLNLRKVSSEASGRQTHSSKEASAEQDAISSLERLQQLRQSGAITETEFDEQKAKLLKRI